MNNLPLDSGLAESRNNAFPIDFKRIGYRALKYWYLVLLSVSLSLFIAYLKNRYAQRIYPVNASIIIRETEEAAGGELLYKNALIDPYRNYLNEPYIIRSYPLLLKTIEELDFSISFYREGNFKTTEAYDLPIKGRLVKRNGSYGASFIFKVIDGERYSLEPFDKEKKSVPTAFNFNDSIVFNNHHLVFWKSKPQLVDQYKGIPYLVTISDPMGVAGSYAGRLKVSWAEEGSSILYINIEGPNPDKEVDFINGLIAQYQRYDLNKKNQTGEHAIAFIKGQLDKIYDSLKGFETKLERFRSETAVTDFSEEAKRLYEKLEPLEFQRGELSMRENYYQYLVQYINQGNGLDKVILPSSLGIEDELLTTLTSNLVDLQLELKLFLNKERGDNPLINKGRNRINEIKKDLVEVIKTLRSTDKIKSDFLLKQIAIIEAQVGRLPVAQRRLVSIERNYNLLENLYVFLMQKMSEAGISKASNVSDIAPVNPPMKGSSISPKTSQNYMIGLAMGLIIPVTIFILMELLNQKIQSKEDLDKISSMPFIGGIGHNPLDDSNLAVNGKPKSAVAESFRALRSNLNFFTGDSIKKVFMISSSISGEGKTFTTINLATVFAMSGRRTLIIGADLRKPKIFQDFNLDNTVGLSTYLSNLQSFEQVVQKTTVDNLDLISGGPIPPNPSELLLTDRFGKLIQEALLIYDYILIDTPPLAIVTDAFVISKYADHTVFVIRQNYTPKMFLRSVDDFYKTGKLKNISVVLNDIYKSGLGYGYGYNYGYGYGSYGYGKGKNGYGYYSE